MLLSSSLLMTCSIPATITHHQHHRDLANCGECPFSNDGYVTLSTHGSDKSHIMKTSLHCQQLVDGMPANQLTQATFGFPHPCQLRCIVPCYIFFLFSTMEQSFFLCLDTDLYAQYALYALYAPSYAPYAPFMLSLGCDELILIPIMPHYAYLTHRHSSYLRICKIFGLYLLVTDFLSSYKNLAYKINLIFYWLKFFEALKLRSELEKLGNKFILDLAKFQINFLLEDLQFLFFK